MTDTLGLVDKARYSALTWTACGVAHAPPLRRALIAAVERNLRRRAAATDVRHPVGVSDGKLAMALALLNIADRALAARSPQ